MAALLTALHVTAARAQPVGGVPGRLEFDAGIIWADAGLDLTSEVIRRFDVAAPVPAAAAPAPRPAAPAAAAPAPRPAAPAAPRPAAPAAPTPAPKK